MKTLVSIVSLLLPCALTSQAPATPSQHASLAELLAYSVPAHSGRRIVVFDQSTALRVLSERGGGGESQAIQRNSSLRSRFADAPSRDNRRNPFGSDTALLVFEDWLTHSVTSWDLHLTKITRDKAGNESVAECYLAVKKSDRGWAADTLPNGRRKGLSCMSY